jgi:hypothetical protein
MVCFVLIAPIAPIILLLVECAEANFSRRPHIGVIFINKRSFRMCCFNLKLSCKEKVNFLFPPPWRKMPYTMIDIVERIEINSNIWLPNTTISLIFDRNSWVFAVRGQRFMKNEQAKFGSLEVCGSSLWFL